MAAASNARVDDLTENMESILTELKLQSLFQRFAEERIQPEDVTRLSDDELVRLGLTTIGDRIRLRDRCRDPK